MSNKRYATARCLEERERLLKKYVENLPTDSAMSLQEIGEMADKMEYEYKQFLTEIWEQVKDDNYNSLEIILDKRYNRYILRFDYAKDISVSHAAAEEITVWEQITNTNIHDVERLNALIYTYAKDLLAHITYDFLEDVK